MKRLCSRTNSPSKTRTNSLWKMQRTSLLVGLISKRRSSSVIWSTSTARFSWIPGSLPSWWHLTKCEERLDSTKGRPGPLHRWHAVCILRWDDLTKTCVALISDASCFRQYNGKIFFELSPGFTDLWTKEFTLTAWHPLQLHIRISGLIHPPKRERKRLRKSPSWFPWPLIRILTFDLYETIRIACGFLHRSQLWFIQSFSLPCKVLAARWAPVTPSKRLQ